MTTEKRVQFKILGSLVSLYLFFLCVIYPFYYHGDYITNLGDDKWTFFQSISLWFSLKFLPFPNYFPGILLIAAVVFLWLFHDLRRDQNAFKTYFNVKALSLTDKIVLLYGLSVVISAVFAEYKGYVIWGTAGWRMGLIAQFIFIGLYFLVSRFWRFDDIYLTIYLTASAIVFIIAILNRFGLDLFNMYARVEEGMKFFFLSTIGQTTWYSSYLCTLLPIGIFVFWYAKFKRARILSAIYLFIGFSTLVTQNSDSAYAALFAVMSLLFILSFENNERMIRFLEIVLIMLLSFRIMGFMQLAINFKTEQMDTLSIICSQHPIMWLFIAISAVLLYLLIKAERKKGRSNKGFSIEKWKWLGRAYLILIIAMIVGVIIYIPLNTLGVLPESLRSTNNYLFFNNDWGHYRGAVWRDTFISIGMALSSNPMVLLFGAGPDSFSTFTYTRAYENMNAVAYYASGSADRVFENAHNEWLNAFVNYGIIGGALYLGIFISAFIRFYKERKKLPELIAPMLCIVSYMAHNFFCYQQCVCTPYIFIIIGCGERILRVGMPEEWTKFSTTRLKRRKRAA